MEIRIFDLRKLDKKNPTLDVIKKIYCRDDLSYNEYGKPFLKDNRYFSLSHTENILCFVDDIKEIGIDIEDSTRNSLKLLKRVMNEKEISYIENDPLKFITLWTIKEAYSKLVGKGLNIDFREIDALSLLNKSHDKYHASIISYQGYIISIVSENIIESTSIIEC